MGTSKRKRRLGAWLLALVMVCSLITVPAKSVEAADSVQVSNALDSSQKVYVEIKKTATIEPYSKDGTWPTVELSQYDVIVHNNSGTTISDWTVTITCNQITNWNAGWNGAERSGNTITIGTYKGTSKEDGSIWTNATIADKETGAGAGFQIATTDMANYSVSLTYKIGESSGTVSKDDTATDPSVIGTKSPNVTVSIAQDEIAGEYHAYYLQVNNRLSESIGDWIVVIPLEGITSSEQWGAWAKVKTSYTSKYLYLTPSSDGVISAGGTFGSTTDGAYKFNYKGSNAIDASKAVVYYKTGSSASGAFNAVVENASQAGGGSSGGSSGGDVGGGTFDGENIGTIDTSLDYNFAKLLQYSLYFYDANMCGDQVSETSLYSKDLYDGWRGDCHVNDKFTYNGKTYSAVGGYHDAGDHVKFGMPMAEAFSTLGLGYLEFGEAFDELGQTEHFKTIMDYYCTYVKSCTVLNAAGNEAEAFCYQVGHGDPDHASWRAPEVEDEVKTDRQFTLVATSSNPATEIVAETAAALAINYLNFGNPEDLKYAKALFAFTMKYKGAPKVDGGFYGPQGYKDDYCLAAAMLYKASNNAAEKAVYEQEFKKEFSPNDISTTHDWANVYQAAALYTPGGSSDYLSRLNGSLAGIANGSKTSYYCKDKWGSARHNCNVQLMMMIYDKMQGGTTAYPEWAKYQMSMILGNNSTGKNLVCGYNTKSPVSPHHRAASGYANEWTDFNNNSPQKYILYGALCGGPTSSDFSTYNDKVNDAVSNEVTLDYNAGLVGSAAALYLKYKDSAEPGFTNQTIHPDFYGGSNFGGSSETVTEVTLDQSEVSIEEGKTVTLTATVVPEGAGTVSWKSSDSKIATVKGGVVTAVKAGTATVTATAGGKSAVCKVTVTEKPVALLEADDVSLVTTYGDTNLTGTKVTITNAGKAEAQSVSAALESGAKVALNTAGLTTIAAEGTADIQITPRAGLTAGSYEDTIVVTYHNGKGTTKLSIPVSLKVNKRNITVKAQDQTKTYGEENPEWSYEVTSGSLVAGDSLDIKYSTTATKTSDAGSYPIEISAGNSNPNYNITTANGTLTIEKKSVKDVQFPNASAITVGDSLESSKLTGGDDQYGSFDWKEGTSVPLKGIVDADVVLTLSDKAKTNYSFDGIKGYDDAGGTITKSVSVWVKAEDAPDIEFPTAKPMQYGQTLSESELIGGSTEYGTFAWKESDKELTEIGDVWLDVVFTPTEDAKNQYDMPELIQKVKVTVDKADNTVTPDTPELIKRTGTTIQVTATEGYEYSKDGGLTWQTKHTFTGLTSFTKYSIIARIKETTTHKASEQSSALTVYTLVEDPYVIDVSKLDDAHYIDALRGADGQTTVEYSDDTLTLKDNADRHSEGYTITGRNPSVTIQTVADTKVTLLDATVKAIKVTGKAVITISGDVKVTDTISSEGNAQVTVNGNGTLDTSGIINNDSVTIKSGTLNIDASGTDHAAIKAQTVVIEGGTVTAIGGNGSPAIAGEEIQIKGGTVTATGGKESPAIAGGEVSIEDGTVTATGGEGSAAISGTNISIKDGTVTANAGKGASAMESTGQIKIDDSQVEVNIEEGSDKSAITSDDIVIIGTTTVSSQDKDVNLYSSKPKDENGNELTDKRLVTRITLDSTSKTVKVGDKVTLKAAVEPTDATDRSVTWSSNNEKIATVDQKGNVTGVAPGTAVITVTAKDGSGKSAACTVKVEASGKDKEEGKDDDKDDDDQEVEKIKITGATKKVAPGKKITLKAVVYPENAANKAVKWTVNNKKYASVNSRGVVTTKKAGKGKKVTVTATSLEDGSIKAVYKISIMKKPVKKIKLSAKKKILKKKQSVTIKAKFTPSKGISKELTWTSSNPKVATVNAKGKVVAKKKGKVKITAKAKDGSGKKATITIKVK